MYIKKSIMVCLLSCFLFACMHTSNGSPKSRLTIVLLPLIPRDDTSQEFCDRVTSTLAAELRELDLFDLFVSENLLQELRLERYRYDHATLQERILETVRPDYVLSGYIRSNKEKGEYSLALDLANFSKFGNEYNDAYLGMKDIDTMVRAHVDRIKRLRIFLSDPDKTLEEYLAILKAHSPDTFPIIAGMPKQRQDHFILGYILSNRSLSGGFNTAIHEGFHSSAYTGRPDQMALYITPHETIRVTTTPVFPTRELATVIPEHLRDGGYDAYITPPDSNASTQIIGIYALLNEFDAYYQGTRVSCDLFSYYKEALFGEDVEVYKEFLSGMYSSYVAYYEFKYFIYTYLLYAQKEKPAVYKGITSNTQFKNAFQKIDAAFGRLIERIYEIENELNEYLAPKGMQLTKDNTFTYIRLADGNITGRSNYQKDVLRLATELQKEEYRKLERQLFQ